MKKIVSILFVLVMTSCFYKISFAKKGGIGFYAGKSSHILVHSLKIWEIDK